MPKEPHLENICQSSMVCDGGFVGLLIFLACVLPVKPSLRDLKYQCQKNLTLKIYGNLLWSVMVVLLVFWSWLMCSSLLLMVFGLLGMCFPLQNNTSH